MECHGDAMAKELISVLRPKRLAENVDVLRQMWCRHVGHQPDREVAMARNGTARKLTTAHISASCCKERHGLDTGGWGIHPTRGEPVSINWHRMTWMVCHDLTPPAVAVPDAADAAPARPDSARIRRRRPQSAGNRTEISLVGISGVRQPRPSTRSRRTTAGSSRATRGARC